jgi:hypothetical protein
MNTVLQVWRNGRVETKPHIVPLKPGDLGTVQALDEMAAIIRADTQRPDVRRFIHGKITSRVRGHDQLGEIRACFNFARDRLVYRRDPFGVERVADFYSTLEALNPGEPEGDCGIKSTILCTSLAVCGFAPYLAVIKQTPDDCGFKHVYVSLRWGGQEMPLDPTPLSERPGWAPRHLVKRYYEIFR